MFGNTLFFRGCVVRHAYPEIAERWRKILDIVGIKTIVLPQEPCCGAPLYNAGAWNELDAHQKRLEALFKKFRVRNIITACPACAHTLQEMGYRAEHVAEVVAQRVEKLRKMIKPLEKKVTYHDPCHLARYLGIVDSPRELIRVCGCELVEPRFYGRFTYCCGGGGGIPANYPAIAEDVLRRRLEQLEETGADIIVTACPMCFHWLSKGAKKPVKELSEIIWEALGGEK